MLKPLKYRVFKKIVDKHTSYVKRMNGLISEYSPEREKARIIILSLGEDARPDPGKVSKPELFFPSFCNVLARCGISSVYVHGIDNLERELLKRNSTPTILINLIHELYNDLAKFELPDHLLMYFSAVFNSHRTATIVGDKQKMNIFLSKKGIPMPDLNPESGSKIFSNTRFGTHDPVAIYETLDEADKNRYNTKYIDTKVNFNAGTYFTSVRLNCIGSHIAQINVRASDQENGNPSVTGTDTPLDRDLLEYLHGLLVAPRLREFQELAETIESVLGPGFYVHDTLIERDTGKIYLSETGFKFMSAPYADHMSDVIGDRPYLTGVMDIETYAAYAASVFVTYCAGKGFI